MRIIRLKKFGRKAASQEGFAIAYVLFIGLLITTLLFTIFGYVIISKRLEAKTIIKKKLDLACYSAVQIVLADPLGENDFRKNLVVDSITVTVEKTRSGLFYEINAIAALGKYSSKYMCRAGSVPDSLYGNGLIVTNPNLNGVIADKVAITGDIVSATNRFTKDRITCKNDGSAATAGKFKISKALSSSFILLGHLDLSVLRRIQPRPAGLGHSMTGLNKVPDLSSAEWEIRIADNLITLNQ